MCISPGNRVNMRSFKISSIFAVFPGFLMLIFILYMGFKIAHKTIVQHEMQHEYRSRSGNKKGGA